MEQTFKIPDPLVGRHLAAALAFSHSRETGGIRGGVSFRFSHYGWADLRMLETPVLLISKDAFPYVTMAIKVYREQVLREGCEGYEGFCDLERGLWDNA